MYRIMSAGPTQVRENVMEARSRWFPNPDVDPDFVEYYKETCRLFSKALGTDSECLILGGEGILGLEAAVASLTEPGDRVLVVDNGIFGKGFADFVSIYRGEPVVWHQDYHHTLDLDALRAFLEQDHDFKYATLVHCDTPSGILNDAAGAARILHEYGILTVVDSVAGMFGEPLDASDIDILLGGSQKALSCPPGLTMVWISDRAWAAMEARKTPVASFYANLLNFRTYYQDQWFPYTMPASDIQGIRAALDNWLADPDPYGRHRKLAQAVRRAVTEAGLVMYPRDGFASTVTVVEVPEGVSCDDLLGQLRREGVLLSGSFDVLAGKVFRIGHMGENARKDQLLPTLQTLQKVLKEQGVALKADLPQVFLAALGE